MKVVFATQTAVVGPYTVVAGSHWPAEDPVVRSYPTLFTDDPRYGLTYSSEPVEEVSASVTDVEQATKAPGEKRATRRV